jgi:hypothetical protein
MTFGIGSDSPQTASYVGALKKADSHLAAAKAAMAVVVSNHGESVGRLAGFRLNRLRSRVGKTVEIRNEHTRWSPTWRNKFMTAGVPTR